MRAVFLLVFCLIAPIPEAAQPPIPGGLDAGPHAIGFRVITTTDPSRPMGTRVPASERTTTRARQLRIHVWFPAAPALGNQLTIGDYLGRSAPGSAGAATHRQDVARLLAVPVGDADWDRYTGVRTRALQDAVPASGSFPLLVGMLRPISVVLGAEYLASHGYVVAYVERQAREAFSAEGLTLEGLVINEHQRDLQMAIARMRTEGYVDPARLGLVGLAAEGLASLALAMRHPDVDAVALLETNWLLPTGASIYQQVAAFDPTALRAPLFFGYSEVLGRNALEQVANIEAMRYASRHLLYFGEPRMTPVDFGTEGAVMASLLEQRKVASAGVLRAFQTAHRYLRTFLDAYVKGDAGARAALAEVPVPRTSGALIDLTSWPAVTPALSRTELRTLLDADLTKALARARADLKNDPKAQVFDQVWLNSQGYDAAIRGQTDRAIALYTLETEAAPRSANAFDSLADMLERVGRTTEALAAAEKGLALLPADKTLTAAERAQLDTLLRARIARLR